MTFEFTYKGFDGRIVFNPGDIIVRMEQQETMRVYEQIFFAQQFGDYEILGGLEFIERVIRSAFGDTNREFVVETFVVSPTVVHTILKYDMKPKPIRIQMDIPVVKRSSANIDLETLERRVRAVEIADAKLRDLELRLKILEDKVILGSDTIVCQQKYIETLEARIEMLETSEGYIKTLDLDESVRQIKKEIDALDERITENDELLYDYIILVGVPIPIPTNIDNLTLICHGTSLDGIGYHWAGDQGMLSKTRVTPRTGSSFYSHPSYPHNYNSYNGISHVSQTWEKTTNTYIFTSLLHLYKLQFLRECTSLTIAGAANVDDYDDISCLTNLNYLTIRSSSSRTPDGKTLTLTPNLTDISWITTLKSLTHVSFLGCTHLVNIAPLAELPNLQHLDIRETGVKNTTFLTNPRLTIVTA